MSESIDKEGCDVFDKLLFVRKETSDIQRLVGLVVFIAGIIFIPIAYLVFLRSRKSYDRMKKRSATMIFLSFTPLFVFLFYSPLRLAIGIENFPCTFVFTTSYVVVMIVVTNLVRVYRLYHSGFLHSKLYQVYKSNIGEVTGLKDLENT